MHSCSILFVAYTLQGLRTKGGSCFAWHDETRTVAVAVKKRLLLFRLLASEGRKGVFHISLSCVFVCCLFCNQCLPLFRLLESEERLDIV